MTTPAKPFTVAAAHAFFKAAHAGQTDKQGRDYYEHHLVPIAQAVEHLGDDAVIAALGHDYIEDVHDGDLDAGVAALHAVGCPEASITAIVSVTRLPGEPYLDLITRSCTDPLGVHLKLADNEHNILSNPALAATDPQKAASLLTKRYLPARDRLIEARTLHSLGLPPTYAADGTLTTATKVEYGRQIIDDSCGNGHLTGYVSSILPDLDDLDEADPDASGIALHSDQRIVRRVVSPWYPVDEQE